MCTIAPPVRGVDEVGLKTGSPSQSTSEFRLEGSDDRDSGLVDVEIYAP
jgi:hypothetical protein